MSSINKELFDDMREKYLKVRKFLDEPQNPSHPEDIANTESKNKATNILKEMIVTLENIRNSTDYNIKIISMLSIVYLNIGIICIDNEELKEAEENLTRCIEILKDHELEAESILPTLSAFNQLFIIWFQWGEFEKAKIFIDKSSDIYKNYKNQQIDNKKPIGMSELFGIDNTDEPTPIQVLEKLHTLTLFYLAQISGVNKDHQKSALYCHMTLKRQLETSDLDHIDWSLNAATLSQFLMERKHFTQALHHLAASSHILNIYKDKLNQENDDSDEIKGAKLEQFQHRSADVSRCWAKYGILLMNMSRDRLIEATENMDDEKTDDDDTDKTQDIPQETLNEMKFDKFDKEINDISLQITDKYLLDFNDAKKVFLNVQKWLDEAKKYYALETHASDYIAIIQDISQSYKYLAFFENDDDNRAKMHKRRIDVLEDAVKELNPKYYQSICRQVWIELGEIHTAILDIKLDKLKTSDERPTNHAIKKINHLSISGIKYYQMFLDSLKETESSEPVKEFTDDIVRPALFSYFHIGTLSNKIITTDKNIQIDNLKNSIDAYKFLVDYCERHADAAEFMKAELSVCKDLANLLSLKMTKLKLTA
ncbi:KIF-binding protein-like [Aphidius gifuensis]|uniref:KIF-binding protein-like n=1 Tax=Aphidius gifuensis TaxID=684658 RepID=UPI001CDBACD8|nr:KIF-binding protein-like [Aphidius gifuensis]